MNSLSNIDQGLRTWNKHHYKKNNHWLMCPQKHARLWKMKQYLFPNPTLAWDRKITFWFVFLFFFLVSLFFFFKFFSPMKKVTIATFLNVFLSKLPGENRQRSWCWGEGGGGERKSVGSRTDKSFNFSLLHIFTVFIYLLRFVKFHALTEKFPTQPTPCLNK